jgi:hypothetical protein
VGIDGRRCECRAFLEFDHVEPVGLDGSHGEDNVRILCRPTINTRQRGSTERSPCVDGAHRLPKRPRHPRRRRPRDVRNHERQRGRDAVAPVAITAA